MVKYDNEFQTKDNKIETKDKIQSQHFCMYTSNNNTE